MRLSRIRRHSRHHPFRCGFYVSRNNAPFAEQEAREAMNFTLLPSIALVALWVVSFLPGMGNIAMVLGALVWLFMAIASLRAGIEVNRGEPYSYRMNPRLLDRFYSTENAESAES